MFSELREFMVLGNEDIGKAFIVAQKHIEFWLQLFDEIGFKQQRLCL